MSNDMIKDIIFEGLAYTVMGMVIVFAVLILIMLVIKAMALFSTEKKQVAESPEQTPVQVSKQAPAVEALPVAQAKPDDTELIAVITAAIAAAMGKSASSLMIRSYKMISGNVWNKAGRGETLENRF